MQLPICALFAWMTIITFSLLPKRLSILDFVFMYCVVVILTTMTFTILDINLHTVTISRRPTISFATIITRVVTIPLWIMMAVDALQAAGRRRLHWMRVIMIWLGLTVFNWLLDFLKVTEFQRPFLWHVSETLIANLGFIVVPLGMTWLYRWLGKREVQNS